MKPSHRSRSERKQQAQSDKEVTHHMWVVQLQEIMNKDSCDAETALVKLKEKVKAAAKDVPPSYLLQYRQAWLEFKRKIELAKK